MTMNDWKEVPHLFCNGKFKAVLIKDQSQTPRDIVGINTDGDYTTITLVYNKDDYDSYPNSRYPEDCQLIARKIEDMSDEEFNHYDMICYTIRSKDGIIQLRKDSPESFLYLLSIGVYPFDQSHFGKTVLTSNEVEQ